MARHREDDLRQFPHQRRISVDITNPLNVVHKDSRPLHDSRAHCPCFALFADNNICVTLIENYFCHLFAADCGAAGVWKPISTKKRQIDDNFDILTQLDKKSHFRISYCNNLSHYYYYIQGLSMSSKTTFYIKLLMYLIVF